uniref:Uncharacterized protein n=1 Tax=Glossina pallidipes TaxID=7398 RepID=A0A1A9ZRT3_GLOPL
MLYSGSGKSFFSDKREITLRSFRVYGSQMLMYGTFCKFLACFTNATVNNMPFSAFGIKVADIGRPPDFAALLVQCNQIIKKNLRVFVCVDLTVQFNERKGHISLAISVAAIVLGFNEKGNIIYMVTGMQVDKVIAFVTVQSDVFDEIDLSDVCTAECSIKNVSEHVMKKRSEY